MEEVRGHEPRHPSGVRSQSRPCVAVLSYEKREVSYIRRAILTTPKTPRRARKAEPNAAHMVIAALSVKETLRHICPEAKSFTLITQNVDGLSRRALDQLTGALAAKEAIKDVTPEPRSIIEMHGRLFDTLCTKCSHREGNHNHPICPALEGTEVIVERQEEEPDIPLSELPRCTQPNCGGLLRPGWDLTLSIGRATGN